MTPVRNENQGFWSHERTLPPVTKGTVVAHRTPEMTSSRLARNARIVLRTLSVGLLCTAFVGTTLMPRSAEASPFLSSSALTITDHLVLPPAAATLSGSVNSPAADDSIPVPEPGSLVLFGSGLALVARWLRRRRKARA
jgi:hypothetical protein